ncbi:HalD/BesD family halogenase [Candidatus Puniceispirillum sp.]|jgi:hypothetical protein|uniref:HalD/BesD family halogenase n=1 Tax=Candidatus Puniceispirillum sp. TaxID=2026719 RepID=UPI001ED368D7|nr:2OG-Fe(II) oxygenase [Candidatus Puniceispirillum sp.]MBT6566678.1 2OG-Fe(II) oxygenase [Candidatus Puniceispirillum sp.]
MIKLKDIINFDACPLTTSSFRDACRDQLNRDGVLALPDFLHHTAINTLVEEAESQKHLAFYTSASHNVYLTKPDLDLGDDHVFNRQITSSKGCITTDQIPTASGLHMVYNADIFRDFACAVLGEDMLYEYADPLSSVNVHFAEDGKELGWHFDNSSFAITLLLQAPKDGGAFEYVRDLRDADKGELNFTGVQSVLDGDIVAQHLTMAPGTLVMFRGRNSMHRVTPTIGDICRILVVFAYNAEPNIALSEAARMTFYGRLD